LGGAFAVYGGHGSTASSTIVYEIEPGKRLGWHTDATEETQYIIAGQGKLYLEDGSTYPVGPGSVFVLPTPMRHDLENTGKETLRAVAFFAAAMFTQDFDQVMMRRRATSSAHPIAGEGPYERAAPSSFKNSPVPKPQAALTRSDATKRGHSAGMASPLIGGTTKNATSASASAPTTIHAVQ
jgi:quercetin dioxygenase-like cupin family protein